MICSGKLKDYKKVSSRFLHEEDITEEKINVIRKLNEIAEERGQTLAAMALSWILRKDAVNTVLIGASKASQILDNVRIVDNLSFSDEELKKIDEILA